MNKADTSITKQRASYIWIGISLVPILLFYGTSLYFNINIPWFDDIENIPYFLANWLEASQLSEQLTALLRPNNEHRVLTARLIVLLQYYVLGHLDFRLLAFMGNLSVLGIYILIVHHARRSGLLHRKLLPVAFLIFTMQFYAMTFMTIMSLQYQMVIFLSFLSFHFLNQHTRSGLVWGLLIAWLDTFSMGNGMMVWPAGLLILLLQRRWGASGLWAAMATLAIIGYFSGYDFVQGNDQGFEYVRSHPVQILIGLMTMLGGVVDILPSLSFDKRSIVPMLVGLLLLVLYSGWMLAKWLPWFRTIRSPNPFSPQQPLHSSPSTPFFMGALAYVLSGILLVVFFRTRFDYQLVLWSTYKLYPACFASIMYILFIERFNGNTIAKIAQGVAGLTAVLVWGSSYYHYIPQIAETMKKRTAFAYNQAHNGIGLGATKGTSFESMARLTFERGERLAFYRFPSYFIHPSEDSLRSTSLLSAVANSTEPVFELDKTESIVSIRTTHTPTPAPEARYVLWASEQYVYVFYIPKEGYTDCPLGMIYPGRYRLLLWEVGKEKSTTTPTDQYISIPQ
jgi:hypothetical protein